MCCNINKYPSCGLNEVNLSESISIDRESMCYNGVHDESSVANYESTNSSNDQIYEEVPKSTDQNSGQQRQKHPSPQEVLARAKNSFQTLWSYITIITHLYVEIWLLKIIYDEQ